MEPVTPEKSRSLHNFSLPPRLSWRNQRLLRCSNADSAAEETTSCDIRYSRRPRPQQPSEASRSRPDLTGSDSKRRSLNGSPEVMREKLMNDLQSEVDKIKNAILVEGCEGDPSATATEDPCPWNLRTRRGACQEPIANCQPLVKFGVKRERKKFSVSLNRREIEEDFMEISRRRPASKPKKRPRHVQKQLDTIYPGLWLSEIKAKMYKVDETPESMQGE